MLCTSGFVDDIMFSYNGPYGGMMLLQQHKAMPDILAVWHSMHSVVQDGVHQH